ncbi:MAG TPA: hypothetical protein DCQ36_10785 [Actinobacteria bacterium]|jgi:hypothetical protein|nr:hypothetical protein [Actinomycetota bacterium]
MPTVRPRYQITETDDIALAVDIGCRTWPHESRSDVMRRLILIGAQRISESPLERALEIETALAQLSELADDYPPGYLADLRGEWRDRATP